MASQHHPIVSTIAFPKMLYGADLKYMKRSQAFESTLNDSLQPAFFWQDGNGPGTFNGKEIALN